MTSLASFTPLESLLLFQALQAHGVTSIPFNNISDQLQSIPLVRNDATFDSARLSPVALKDLYLTLLKEEARKELDRLEARDTDGHLEPRSTNGYVEPRDTNGHLPTVDDAAKHAHLIPKLIYRLYATYRERVVQEIRSDERRYDALTKEIREIDDGLWDERLQKDQPQPPQAHATGKVQVQVQQQPGGQGAPSPALSQPPLSTVHQDRLRPQVVGSPKLQSQLQPQPSIEAANSAPSSPARLDAIINSDAKSGRSTPSPYLTQPLAAPLPPHAQAVSESTSPFGASHHQPYATQPPLPHTGHAHQPSTLPPQYPRPNAQRPSPILPPGVIPRPSPTASPRPVLPVPPTLKAQSQSPVMQNGPPNHRPPPQLQPHPSQQYPTPVHRGTALPPPPANSSTPRALPPYPLNQPAHAQPYPHYNGAPQPQPYPQPANTQAQQPYQARPSAPVRPNHATVQIPRHVRGGVQLPPFQVGPQEPIRSQPQLQSQPPPQPQSQNIVQQAPPQPARPTPISIAPQPFPPYASHGPHAQQQSAPELARLVASIVQGLSNKPWATWKAARPAHLLPPASNESPPLEPLSPVLQRAAPPARLPQVGVRDGSSTSPEQRRVSKDRKIAPMPTRKSTRQSRAGSSASSIVGSSVRARTRSHSVVSHTESQPAQFEASASVRRVKDEPTTPAESENQELLVAPVESPALSKGRTRRRSTMQTLPQPSSKRKRQRSDSPAAEDTEAVATYVAPRNDVVAASRNFPRLSAVIMNEISTHKYAGPFQKPVREKDAEGYTDIIKRPQDLKSLKAAITVGTRAIGAATVKETNSDSPFTTPSGNKEGGTIVLEKTADLIPPRAVVNSSQLEKEVMRMFANAVMFNPGEGGMVQDAREMADDIEAKIRDWRSAERQVDGRDEDDDSAAVSGPGKRRKL